MNAQTRQCGAPFAHTPHVWPQGQLVISTHGGPYHCPGVTSQRAVAEAMRRRGARQDDWRHLIDAHGIHVSERAYGAKVNMWKRVDAAIHEAWDAGYKAGMTDAAEQVTRLADEAEG